MFNFLVKTLEKLSALVPCKLSHNQNWQRKTIMTIRTGIKKVRKAWSSWVPWDQHRGLQHHLHRSLRVGRIPQRAIRNSIHRTSVGHSRRLQHGFRQFFATIFFSIIKIPLLDKNKTNNYVGFAWVRSVSNSRKTMTLNLKKKSLSQGQSHSSVHSQTVWRLVKCFQQWREIFYSVVMGLCLCCWLCSHYVVSTLKLL